MTLPIAMSRPAPDGNPPTANEPFHGTGESNVVFRRALASAMKEDGAPRSASRERTDARADGRSEALTEPLTDARAAARIEGVAAREGDPEGERHSALPAEQWFRAGPRGDDAPMHYLPIDPPSDSPKDIDGPRVAFPGTSHTEGADVDADTKGERLASEFVAQPLEDIMAAAVEAEATAQAREIAPHAAMIGASPAATHTPHASAPSTTGLGRSEGAARISVEPHDHDATLRSAAASMARRASETIRDLEGLVPDLRTRLERVITRMEEEFGYTVEVVETVRSQERQDALFAQGRTRPGPVVTWTRNSKHVDGRAADVVIDGGYDNTAGFERLARVAREEGLRTLWPRDPGHIELATPSGARGSSRTISAAVATTAPSAAPTQARPAAGNAREVAPAAMTATTLPPSLRAARVGIDAQAGRVPSPIAAPTDLLPPPLQAEPALGVPSIAELPDESDRLVHTRAVERAPLGRAELPPAPAWRSPHTAPAAALGAEGTATSQAAAGGQAGVAGVARVATVAAMAQVARVARVARVADVADVAVPGQSTAPASPAAPALQMPGQVIAGQEGAAGGGVLGGDHGSARERGGEGHGARDDRQVHALPVAPERERSDRAPIEMGRDLLTSGGTRLEGAPGDGSPVAGLARSDATERIARVLRLQEAGSDRPLSSVLLRLDNPDGGEDRIRIDMRGRSIGATLDVADARAAEHLRAHVPELQEALQRQGLEGEALVIRSASRNTDAGTLSASAASAERDLARAASATASDGGGSTARDSRNPPRGSHEREGTDQQRSRQRRDGKEDRQ